MEKDNEVNVMIFRPTVLWGILQSLIPDKTEMVLLINNGSETLQYFGGKLFKADANGCYTVEHTSEEGEYAKKVNDNKFMLCYTQAGLVLVIDIVTSFVFTD
jgi:hypothetical protein